MSSSIDIGRFVKELVYRTSSGVGTVETVGPYAIYSPQPLHIH